MAEVVDAMAAMSTADGGDDAAAKAKKAAANKKKRDAQKRKKAAGGGGGDADGGDFEGDFESISEGGVDAAITAGPGEAAAVEVSGGGNAAAAEDSVLANGAVKASDLSREKLVELLSSRKKKGEASDEPHAFWDTQPVPKIGTEVTDVGPLVEQTVDEIRKEPYPMAPGMEWALVNVLDPKQSQEVYELLTENYVEDDDAMFRFDYSVPFLLWALTPPGFMPELHLGVRSVKSKKLMAIITGVPATMVVQGQTVKMVEINFLCVHKKLRSKRLAPVLIKEITRRVNVNGIFQAVYTAGVVLPTPVAECRYWHRSLNPKKLVEIGFTRISERMNLARTIKLYKVAEFPKTPGIQPMLPEHVPSACKLLNDYLSKFKLAPHFNETELAHMLLPREGVVSSFVVLHEKTSEVTDMCSFYHLPSSCCKSEKHKTLRAVYSFYNVATTVPLKQLFDDLLIMAKREDADVFNALDLHDNGSVLKDLKFGVGDGHLQYYLYNYKCPKINASDIGLVLL